MSDKRTVTYLAHFGIPGMKWYRRRFQNPDGTLTESGRERYTNQKTGELNWRGRRKIRKWAEQDRAEANKKDLKYLKKKDKTINKLKAKTHKELKKDLNNMMKSNAKFLKKNGQMSAKAMFEYNQKYAEVLNKKIESFKTTPSGKTITFVANRAEIGVSTLLIDESIVSPNSLPNGIYTSGKVAYKSKILNKI